MASALTAAVNLLLKTDPEGATGLAELEGRQIRVQAQGLPTNWLLSISASKILVTSSEDITDSPDVSLTGTPLALLRLAVSRQGAESFGVDVFIQGDIGVMKQLKRIIDNLDFDFEEPLAQVVGDVAAHELMRRARSAQRFGARTRSNLAQDISEYLVEEGRYVTTRTEVDEFNAAVDDLRDDTARLEHRLRNLATRIR